MWQIDKQVGEQMKSWLAAVAGAMLFGSPAQAIVSTTLDLKPGREFAFVEYNSYLNVSSAPSQSFSVSYNNGSATATAIGSANLKTGTLYAQGISGGPAPVTGVTRIDALFEDELRFTVAGATAATVTPITLSWTLTGDFFDRNGGLGSVQAQLLFGVQSLGGSLDIAQNTNAFLNGATGLPDGIFTVDGLTKRITGRYDLLGAAPVLKFRGLLRSFTEGSVRSEFTSVFDVLVPGSVSYTSESGVALTQGAVPEPESWVLLVAGFGVAGGLMRRRRRAAA